MNQTIFYEINFLNHSEILFLLSTAKKIKELNAHTWEIITLSYLGGLICMPFITVIKVSSARFLLLSYLLLYCLNRCYSKWTTLEMVFLLSKVD